MPVATLRSWESRYGVPRALPREGGHRRYEPSTVEVVLAIVARRAGGLTLEAAAGQSVAPQPDPSVFAVVRSRHPELPLVRMTRAALLRLTRAVEDEYAARAERAILFGAFQTSNAFASAEARWRDLARLAKTAVVFADFGAGTGSADGPVRVGLDPDSPLHREWILVCDADGFAAAVAGREGLTRSGRDDPPFDVWWSLDPWVVRSAARLCADHVAVRDPVTASGLTPRWQRLDTPPPRASEDLRRATSLFHRVLTLSGE